MIGSITRRRNFFILDTQPCDNKVMLIKGRWKPTYLLSKNPKIRFWHRRLEYTSNTRVIEAPKLIDDINITIDKDQQEDRFSLNYKNDNKNPESSPISPIISTTTSTTTILLKIIKIIYLNVVKQLYNPCIESKHTKIVKYKKITSTTYKLQEIYVDLWGLHNLPSLLDRIYMAFLLNEFTYKSWVLLLQSKDKFFDVFKLWLPQAIICGEKLRCLQVDGGREFISTLLKNFCNKKDITIDYTASYLYQKTG